ncbi:MAG TPA: hypothetical protein VGG03_04690 [Thermoanaerobaculia bacterium]|jgi:hypothetical protein
MAVTTIRRFGVFSVGKQLGITYALIGLIVGAIIALVSLFGAAFGASLAEDARGALPGAVFGVGAIIIAPIFYGLIGLIGGIIMAAIYNLVAGATGGVEVELTGPVGAPGYGTAP